MLFLVMKAETNQMKEDEEQQATGRIQVSRACFVSCVVNELMRRREVCFLDISWQIYSVPMGGPWYLRKVPGNPYQQAPIQRMWQGDSSLVRIGDHIILRVAIEAR